MFSVEAVKVIVRLQMMHSIWLCSAVSRLTTPSGCGRVLPVLLPEYEGVGLQLLTLWLQSQQQPTDWTDQCTLGQVDDDATLEEIKKAYRSLAKECHPDYLGDQGHNICILLNEAYEVRACCVFDVGCNNTGLQLPLLLC